jgi:hypothetical protein
MAFGLGRRVLLTEPMLVIGDLGTHRTGTPRTTFVLYVMTRAV